MIRVHVIYSVLLIFLFWNINECIYFKKDYSLSSHLNDKIISNVEDIRISKRSTNINSPCNFSIPIDFQKNSINDTLKFIKPMWLKDETMLLLTTDSNTTVTKSHLWLYKANFGMAPELINFEHTIQTVLVSPVNKEYIIIILADLKTIYTSRTSGLFLSTSSRDYTFPHKLDVLHFDEKLTSRIFHPTIDNYLLMKSGNTLYYSTNFGTSWIVGKIGPNLIYTWAHNDSIIYSSKKSGSKYGNLFRTDNLFIDSKIINNNTYSFHLRNGVLFISQMSRLNFLTRRISISIDFGDHFYDAMIPEIYSFESYYPLEVTENFAMLHLGSTNNPEKFAGRLYVSDSKYIEYTYSLANHLITDFNKINSIRGVYITSVLYTNTNSGTKFASYITYNGGGDWSRIKLGPNYCNSKKCYLNIVSKLDSKIYQEPLSLSEAKGVIMAHGIVGKYVDLVSHGSPSIFYSEDGGYKWLRLLESEGQYLIGNYGNVLLAANMTGKDSSMCRIIDKLWYSHSLSTCLSSQKLPDKHQNFQACGFSKKMTPEATSFYIWGSDSDNWQFIEFDFEKMLERECNIGTDFDVFQPHKQTGCLLGYNETFLRVKSDSICLVVPEIKLDYRNSPCKCNYSDFECEFGYQRKLSDSQSKFKCEPIDGYDLSQHCKPNQRNYTTNSLGLRKISGDFCTNPSSIIKSSTLHFCEGWDRRNIKELLKDNQSTITIAVGVVLIVIVIGCIIGGVYFVCKHLIIKQASSSKVVYTVLPDSDTNDSDGENDTKIQIQNNKSNNEDDEALIPL